MFLLYNFNVVFFFFFIVVQISYWWLLRDLLLALLEDIWGHLSLVLIILCYIFCIVIKHFELLYMLQTIIVWKKFELDTCFILYLWNVWIFFYKWVVEINVPEAHTRIRGKNWLVAYSIKRVIFSPTTEPILPPINWKSITPIAMGKLTYTCLNSLS